MATAYGDNHLILGVAPPTFTMYDATGSDVTTGWVNPEMDEASITVGFTAKEQMDTSGEISQIRFHGEYLEATFTLRPTSTNSAQTMKSARLPGAGYSFAISGMKIIQMGSFADAFNTNGSSTQPWFAQPGASLRGPSQEAATVTVTCRRYAAITSRTPLTE
jgi:hypothetical protein